MLKFSLRPSRIFLILIFTYTNILGQHSDTLKIPLNSSREFVSSISAPLAYDSTSLLFDPSRVYKGIPKDLTGYIIKTFDFQPAQSYYELYNRLKGEMTIENLAIGLKKIHFKLEDTVKLSKAPIKHFASFLVGKKQNGISVITGDVNNDYDFSNDKMYEFDSSVNYESLSKSDYGVGQYFYQYSDNGKIVDKTIDLQIFPTTGGMLKYNYPIEQKYYMVVAPHILKRGLVNADGVAYKLNIFSYQPFNIYKDPYVRIYFYEGNKEQGSLYKSLRDTIVLGKTKYLIDDITLFGDTLTLSKVSGARQVEFGIEKGTYAYDISGRDIVTNALINSSNMKGKYLLVDFWGTWCGPCKALTGDLKSMYDQLDKSKVEFISIAYDENDSLPRQYIKEHHLNWNHLFVSGKYESHFENVTSNSSIQKYKIQGYPTLLLIDPAGKIIAREEGIGEGWIRIHEFLKAKLAKTKAKPIKNKQFKN